MTSPSHQQEFQDIYILIPGYSIEDLPTDLTEEKAASLLNAFAAAWHPELLVRSARIPDFRQADAAALPTGRTVVFVPESSTDWLPHDWQQRLTDAHCPFVFGFSDRSDYCRAVEELLQLGDNTVPEDLKAEFFALGTAYVQVRLLSRRMHHFVDPDNHLLANEAFDAAAAAVAGDAGKARDHLRRCFECLLDCREQFYPIPCCLLDLCLPSETTSAEDLTTLIRTSPALTLLVSGEDLTRLCGEAGPVANTADSAAESDHECSQFVSAMKAAVQERRLSLLTGHMRELRLTLSTLRAAYCDIAELRDRVSQQLGDAELHWARRRFGITSEMPTLLKHFEFTSALHVVLDNGIYPDRERGQMSWQAESGTTIPATSRIPVAVDSAAAMLRFPDRMTESMQEDRVAMMMLARLPQLQTPWLRDLQIIASYAPVLGEFVTLDELVNRTSDQVSPTKFGAGEYLSPYLIQSSVLKTESPVSSPAELYGLRRQQESVSFLLSLQSILEPSSERISALPLVEQQLADTELRRLRTTNTDSAAPSMDETDASPTDTTAAGTASIGKQLAEIADDCLEAIRRKIPQQESSTAGRLLVNPSPWKRTCLLDWPNSLKLPAADSAITGSWEQDGGVLVSADIPAGGFVWLHESSADRAAVVPVGRSGKPLAEELLLRNRFFEVHFSEATGGIASVVWHGQRSNRVSQQVSFRFDQPKSVRVDDETISHDYARPRLVSSRVLSAGPYVGEIENRCEITDPVTGDVMAKFRQITTVEREQPHLSVRIFFDDIVHAPRGNPWMTYYACRFAWDNESAAVTRSLLGQACGFRNERFESPDYIEAADEEQRLLIIPYGRPWHRRTSGRTLDSLLLVEGEDHRDFRFRLCFDESYPMRAVAEAMQP
ncbi:MAG: hypothetical protein KDA89_16065, partial [Planctomycetaceae bacterium]|nr:hypothetical protein [Planctomycetaceae bacterium]